MPTKKRVETEAAAEPKPARRASKKPAAEPKAASPRKAAVKDAAKPATAAATHKSPAKRVAPKKAALKAFDVELHREEIEHEAYLIWAGRGHEHGQAQADWLRAIEIVKTRHEK